MTYSWVFYLVIVCLIISLCACGSESAININFSPENENIVDLTTYIYSHAELVEISQFPGGIIDINKVYPIECIRKIDNMVRLAYKGDGYIAILMYEGDGTKIMGRVYSCVVMKSAFDSLEVGSTIDDVRNVDIYGNYTFLYTGRDDVPRISTHYTTDGYLVTISYDEHNFISSITTSLI